MGMKHDPFATLCDNHNAEVIAFSATPDPNFYIVAAKFKARDEFVVWDFNDRDGSCSNGDYYRSYPERGGKLHAKVCALSKFTERVFLKIESAKRQLSTHAVAG